MKVVIDTNPLYTSRAGVCRYVNGLLAAMPCLENAPDIMELAWPVENLTYRQPDRAIKTAYRELIWPRTRAAQLIQSEIPDILHTTANLSYRVLKGVRHIHTLYDLAVVRHPERFRSWHRSSWRRHLCKVALADRILCISQFTADEAMSLLGIPADRLAVTYCGHSLSAVEPATKEQLQAAAGRPVPSEFFLFVGSLEPGKNLDLLRRTYGLARTKQVHLPPLVIVGARREGVAAEAPAPEDWIYLGRQSDAVLVALYRSARALLFPSRYEGFGLPVLEAMALGCPVVCSPIASLPEVGGAAVLYAEQNAESYLKTAEKLLKDSTLREDLIGRGKTRAEMFSWQRCARQTVQVYEDVLKP